MLIDEIAIKTVLENSMTNSMALAKLAFEELGKDDPDVKELRGWFFVDKDIKQAQGKSLYRRMKRIY
jgi:hypothetical protein